MPLRLTEIRLTLDEGESLLTEKAAERLDIPSDRILDLTIVRKSIDARKKGRVSFVYTLDVEIEDHSSGED